MHKLETIEGDLYVRSTDWEQTDRAGTRSVRLGGCAGATTAELIRTPLGWVAQSWIMQPPRTAWFDGELSLEWAVHALETAEGLGQAAPAWLPVSQPGGDGIGLRHLRSAPGQPRCWAYMLNSHSLRFMESVGPGGTLWYQVVIDGVMVAGPDGAPLAYSNPIDAQFNAEQAVGST